MGTGYDLMKYDGNTYQFISTGLDEAITTTGVLILITIFGLERSIQRSVFIKKGELFRILLVQLLITMVTR